MPKLLSAQGERVIVDHIETVDLRAVRPLIEDLPLRQRMFIFELAWDIANAVYIVTRDLPRDR